MTSNPTVYFHDHARVQPDPGPEILAGLRESPRSISPKFFYDERGSELFTAITRLPEYYPTRTEISLLREHAEDISRLVGDDVLLIEYGSGSSEKIRILLDNVRPAIYAPLDISRDYLAQAAESLGQEYPWLEIHATCVDFTSEFELPFDSDRRRVGFFPGSSIGNFSREEAADFLARIRHLVGDRGGLLLGVDLKKDVAVLNAAYNDSAGVTAAFNLNVLTHLNREYGANFDPGSFRHFAAYDEELGCIQMFLISCRDQQVQIGEAVIDLKAGERIHTENSFKYSLDEMTEMARGAGFEHHHSWVDADQLFGVLYLHN